ncbi:putative oligomycin resistance ATP-dependent permease [Clavispora lusitaniae]|uniref:Oligomycin resistance ATP-dependent permease n=1 Tax=Clavispora lusitaniae TaxID=36911 RepID=A0ACD0WNQ3_CLALS|nr:putative oligomycin resistance ATP-dependent permease [Clavispora lusitaniae]QFZ34871.1 putative oligomycin resistance ATP-dependent permease [Clavispora lusitaniae]QFZ40556.1 putative oligomycin resistance ATP-dependent permease [Clavispora lusitaniae]QFZ46236.1 putative oligomycin resistance ATP-dependent permease [Clavispora lusitaniae]QFZ51898.1 putative oligomycin resistance ATP-dependent permease [Clavispora lusitaniae]
MSEHRLQRRLLTPFLSKKVPPIPEEDERIVYPKRPNIFSIMFFWWLGPVMRAGYKRTLTAQDLYKLNDDIKVESMTRRFEQYFQNSLNKAMAAHVRAKMKARGETAETNTVDFEKDMEDFKVPKMIIVRAIARTFTFQYGMACLMMALGSTGNSTTPLLTKKLIRFVELRTLGLEKHMNAGIGYAIGSSIMVLVNGLFVNHAFHLSMLTGAQVKAALTKALLDKSFRLSDASKHEFPTSKITSMMGADLARIDFALGFQPFLITFPVPIAISIGILCHNIGAPAMVGVGLIIVFMVLTMFVTGKLFAYRKTANVFTDARVNYVKEVLNNLKVIKFYSWEIPYSKIITENRNKEMNIVYIMQVARNIITSLGMSLTLFSSLVAFLVLYAIQGSTKDPASIFSSISLFSALASQVFMIPLALASGSDALIGVTRIGEFLAAEEVNPRSVRITASEKTKADMEANKLALSIKNASFKWETFGEQGSHTNNTHTLSEKENFTASEKELYNKLEKHMTNKSISTISHESASSPDHGPFSDSSSLAEQNFPGLESIDLDVKKGEFVVITGLIGSGKTSLLNAMAGFMKRVSGSVDVNGSLLLCDQPWIQNATVRENILFGLPMDDVKYKNVVYACSLESDLEILPAGDLTEIGERGITLSGGQKARINLARAVYADMDIILLDDVLSAVDARVGKHIMAQCIMGILKDKTRILATHQLSLIGSADRIVFLNGNGSISVGTFEELKSKNEAFSHLMAFNADSHDSEDEKEEEVEDEEEREAVKELVERQVTRYKSRADEEEIRHDYEANADKDGRLIDDEEKAENGIKFEVYKNYLSIGSGIFKHYSSVPIVIVLIALSVFCQLFTNTWLSFWSEKKFAHKSNGFYIGFYVMFTFLAAIFLTLEFVLLAYLTNNASTKLNLMAVQKVLRAPMSYMDVTPMGRILNRFTKDTDTLDNEIGNQIRMLTYFFSNIVGVLVLCVIYLPWFAIAIPFLGFIFVAIGNFYQASAREIKRLEAVQRSFVYNNFNETLSGMKTIKAYQAEERFLEKNDTYVNNMNEAYYITIANQRWLSIHLDFVAAGFALIICFLCVFRVFKISAASVGLLLSYVLQIAGQLSMLVRTYTQVENEMNSVERICEYALYLPEEAPYNISETKPADSWPEHGAVRFENVSLAYRPGLPLVLKNLSADIKPKEKIGICGRTGAGKSSIMTALYRLSELNGGKIEIDGVDISKLGLNDLRSKLSIIPQDPVLFRGTIRKNLDPFNLSSEDVLWSALRRAGLIEESKLEFVKTQKPDAENLHKFHLDREVEDEGSNFSLGERQLISFARAMVRDSKILILDEATSSVDYETDSKIQSTIVREFGNCTILCIAHRLRTILNYDRILVLDRGEIKEFDTPWNLFQSEDGIFKQMCERSNITKDDFKH